MQKKNKIRERQTIQDLQEHLGQSIKDRLSRLKLSQKKLAADIGVCEMHMNQICNAKRLPGWALLISIADYLNLRVVDLLDSKAKQKRELRMVKEVLNMVREEDLA